MKITSEEAFNNVKKKRKGKKVDTSKAIEIVMPKTCGCSKIKPRKKRKKLPLAA